MTTKTDDEDDEIKSFQFKIVILGDGSVGKTSIATRFTTDSYSNIYKQTIGVDFFTKKLHLHPNYYITLQIWDIGGQSIG